MGATRQLADFVASTDFEQLPPEVVRESKRCVLNYLGVALGASRDEAVRLLADTVEEIGGNPQATLLGSRTRSSALNAAMVNGAMSHLLDFDDTHLATIIHPTGPVLSAALPLAEWKGLDGKQLITGLALGMEV
ncbi:MAG: MmgE/PrpD family protein, partial [Chloroflexota bacterium]